MEVDPAPWRTTGAGTRRPWKAAIVKLSNRAHVKWIESKSLSEAAFGELAVSREGSLAAAIITPSVGQPFIVVSMYAAWDRLHKMTKGSWIYADASVHRLISDLSVLIGTQTGHRILVAGDLNILYGYGEPPSSYWARRYATVFARMEALGLEFVGPQYPNGRRADPWPDELPPESANLPTYHTNRQTPETATRQLDFVFASAGLAKQLRVRALNEPDQWGPSDHCRIEIEVADAG